MAPPTTKTILSNLRRASRARRKAQETVEARTQEMRDLLRAGREQKISITDLAAAAEISRDRAYHQLSQ